MEPRFKAVRKFTDREEPTNIFSAYIENLIRESKSPKVLVFYGIGGVGKTRLISHLREMTKEIDEKFKEENGSSIIRTVSISLDVYEFDTPVSILISLRDQLGIPCVLFDYALFKYWALVGHSPLEVKKWFEKDSIVKKIIEAALSYTYIPLSLVEEVHDVVRVRFSNVYAENKQDFERVRSVKDDATELSTLLPIFLGKDISTEARERGLRYVFFIDSFESIRLKFGLSGSRNYAEQFLMDLILSAGSSLFVIAGREFLKWQDLDPVWQDKLDQHIMSALTPEDSEYFLKSVPIEDDKIRNAIIETSGGLPLYLDLCVSIYERRVSEGLSLNVSDFRIPERRIVERFMSHLSESERELIKLLSAIHFFDYDLFGHIIKEFNVGYALTRFEEFVTHSFIGETPDAKGIYKIHDTFRAYVIGTYGNERWVEKLGKTVISYLNSNRSEIDFGVLALYFPSALSLLENASIFSTRDGEEFLDVSIFLIDNGYWKYISNVIEQTKIRYNSTLKSPIYLAYAACLGRGGKLKDALEALEKVQESDKILGKYETYRAYYEADTLRIIGRIPESRKKFKDLEARVASTKDTELLIKVMRQRGDLTYLHSEFNEALSILNKVSDMCQPGSRQYAETIRIEGHVYRFNMMLDKAAEIYNEALDIAEKTGAIGLQGELLNNLTEVNCWFKPDDALSYGSKSLIHNTDIGFKVEIGKTHAAMSIAYTVKHNYEEASAQIKEALKIQQETGYQGGVMISNVAALILATAEGDIKARDDAAESIRNYVTQAESNKFIELLVSICLGEDTEHLRSTADWLDFDTTRESYEKFSRSIKGRIKDYGSK